MKSRPSSISNRPKKQQTRLNGKEGVRRRRPQSSVGVADNERRPSRRSEAPRMRLNGDNNGDNNDDDDENCQSQWGRRRNNDVSGPSQRNIVDDMDNEEYFDYPKRSEISRDKW